MVCSPPVSDVPRANLPYGLDFESSYYGIGCELFQTHPDGERKPIGFWPRSLLPTEENYSPSEREWIAVIWGLKTLRPYLMNENFTVYTDHEALRWILTINDPSGRHIRWRLSLAEFDFELKYKKGNGNAKADALSRLNIINNATLHDDHDNIPISLIESINLEPGLNQSPDDVDVINV